MRKKELLLISLIIFFLPLELLFLYQKDAFQKEDYFVAGIKESFADVKVSAFVGEFRFSLWGYTSPNALVSFSGQGIYEETQSDKTGYFEFKNRFSPFSPNEACLQAKDKTGRLTSPVCLPPFPVKTNVSIGPVIMPPTLSLDKNEYFVGDEVVLKGETLPKSKIVLSMFNKPNKTLNLLSFKNFIKPVEAFSLPKIEIQSDEKGNFSVGLPSSQAETFRLFSQVRYQDTNSQNSLTLTLKIKDLWMIILDFFFFIFFWLKNHLLEVLIAFQIGALLIYYFKLFHLWQTKKITAIVLKEKQPLVLVEKSLVKV